MTERNDNSKVVLEIGVGGHPFPVNPTMLDSHDGRQLNQNFKDGSMYIGIDSIRDPNRYWDSIMAFFQGTDLPESSPGEDKKLVIRNLEKILSNVSRVIKPDGKIVIRETGTPWWSWPEKLPDFLKENGFEVEEVANWRYVLLRCQKNF